ncbi:mitochondrial chaperone bcs1 [Penicillium sp. IBT 35674x]|nr:mitochondrial chaperone bcs1 [Penicillium sp. IBT 35674x]
MPPGPSWSNLNTDRGALIDMAESIRRPLKHVVKPGVFLFWYKGRLLRYQATQDASGYFKENNIAITCLGRSGTILKDLLQDCQREYTLNPKIRSWYTQRSLPLIVSCIPPLPGTGKSSFSLAIAGELNMDIYVVRVPGMDDENLKCLFAGLPAHCVVLLEDIDAVISAHSRESEAAHSNEQSPLGDEEKRVNLSGLLKELDGISSQADGILIMTTNHADKLDPALVRPGRIDKRVNFALGDRDVVSQIYCLVFQSPSATGAAAQSREKDTDVLQTQAVQFAYLVPEGVFSPAEILSFLLPHRYNPNAAQQGVQRIHPDIAKLGT